MPDARVMRAKFAERDRLRSERLAAQRVRVSAAMTQAVAAFERIGIAWKNLPDWQKKFTAAIVSTSRPSDHTLTR